MNRLATIFSVGLAMLFFSITAMADVLPNAENGKMTDPRWKKVPIQIVFSTSLLKLNPAVRAESDIQGAVKRSLESWEAAADIEFQVSWSDKTSISPTGNAGDGASLVTIAQTSENLVVFSGESIETAARTRVFYNRRGEISEADIVLNPYQQFSTDGSIGTFDFEATLTHEIGHLLGLDHSSVIGATMNEFQGKNGIFNLSSFSQRTLSLDDVTRIRALYGAANDEECCGSIDGKVFLTNVKGAKGQSVWVEETETGRVAGETKTTSDGSFQLKGLETGKYTIYIQDQAGVSAGQVFGEAEVFRGRTTTVNKKITPVARNFDAQFTGFNGQLSKIAVPLNSGKSYLIYIGGKNLNPEDQTVGTTSPNFTISKINPTKYDYGHELTVFSFEIKSTAEIPVGDYTIFIQNKDGAIDYLPGALTVEKFSNPWSSGGFD